VSDNKTKIILIIGTDAQTAASISGALTQAGYKTVIPPDEKASSLQDYKEGIDLAIIDSCYSSRDASSDGLLKRIITENIPVICIADNQAESAAVPAGIRHSGIIARNSGACIITSSVEIAFRLHESDRLLSGSAMAYREIFDASRDALFVHDGITGAIVDVNRTMLKMYGYDSIDEVLKLTVENLSAADQSYNPGEAVLLIKQALESGNNRFEWRARRKNGEVFWIDIALQSVIIGGVVKIIAAVRDISERKKVEEELQRTESGLIKERIFTQLLLDTTPAFIVAIDLKGKILMMNRAFLDFAGYSMDDLRGAEYLSHIVPAEDRQQLSGIFSDLLNAGKSTVNENRIISRSGSMRLVEWHGQFVNTGDDDGNFFVGVGVDITDRKQAEEEILARNEELMAMNEEMEASNEELIAVNYELQTAEERYRGVVETQSEMIARFRDDGTLTFTNRAWRNYYGEYLGLTGDVAGKKIQDIMQIKNYDQVIAYLHTLTPGQLSGSMERSVVSLAGETRWQLWYIQKIVDEARNLVEYQVVGNDITERKAAETALRNSEERFRSLIELAPDAILIGSSEGIIIGANRSTTELSGYSYDELIGKSINLFFTEDERKRVPLRYDLLKDGHAIRNERILTRRDGSTIFIEMNTKMMPDGTYQAFIRDMTEQRRLMDAIQQADRLSSLGVLAGGIAHDFNNLLSGIFGYIEMARLKSSNDKIVSGYLDKAFTVFNRARDLTQQLLTFSKGGTPVRKTGDIGMLIRESTSFALSGSNIVCDFDIAPDLKLCDFDENQMGQVIDNIIINAKQAMPLGGRINISAADCRLEHKQNPVLGAGDYIKISISDTGIGIPPDMINRIYDPFFTTKQQGNGLGLATAYSIIRNHGGYIEAESIPGEGTTFYIYIPVSLKAGDPNIQHHNREHSGSGRILVMDDEAFIREIASELLSDMGYAVTCAVNGEDALSICSMMREKGEQFDAAFFDLTIPGGMGGKEAIAGIRQVCSDMLVFASSGFSEDPIMSHPVEFGFTGSIRKPYRKDELAALLNRYMNKQK